jgi:hypothetical protein
MIDGELRAPERLGETSPIIPVQVGGELPRTVDTKWLHDSDDIALPENFVTLSPGSEEYQVPIARRDD